MYDAHEYIRTSTTGMLFFLFFLTLCQMPECKYSEERKPLSAVCTTYVWGVLYLITVFTLKALAAVMRHLVADQVGLPVEGLGALVTLVLSLLCVNYHVLAQTAGAQGTRTAGSVDSRGESCRERAHMDPSLCSYVCLHSSCFQVFQNIPGLFAV